MVFLRKAAQALAAMIGVLLLCLPLFSQGGETGRISGTVTDQTGGAIVGATVAVTDVARGQTRTLTTDAAGLYAAPNLIPGIYTVQAMATGFQVLQRQNIQVGVGTDVRIDLTLQPGSQAQTVTVTGEAPTMNTTNAQTGGTLENNLLANLPINGGSYRNIVQVLPGVSKVPGGGVNDQSTNGGWVRWDNYMLDGLYDVNVWANSANVGSIGSSGDSTLLPIDAIQEINLIETPKAQYGFFPGVTIDVGLKSGTNQIHGTAFVVGRDTGFDARNAFFATRAPVEVEQFGGTLGGPIKKDKLFYFVTYEGSRSSVGYITSTTAPTEAPGLKAGVSIPDAIAGINAVNTSLLNELSVNIAGCDWTNPNIHSTTVATVASACQNKNQFGAPDLWGNLGTGAGGTLPLDLPDSGSSNQGLGKLDYKINDKNSFNIEYYMGDAHQTLPAATSASPGVPTQPWWGNAFNTYTRTGRAVWIWTPNSSWVNEARGGYDFQDQPTYNSECGDSAVQGKDGSPASYLASYGLVSGTVAVNGQQGCGFPLVQITGFFGTLDGTSLRRGGGRDVQFSDNVSYTRGQHQFMWGANIRKQCLCDSDKNVTAAYGNVSFGKYAAPGFGATTPTALQDFLAGAPSSEAILNASGVSSLRSVHWDEVAVFLQDDWRIARKLTLNLGVREEVETPGRASHGLLAQFDPNTPSGMVQSNQMWALQSAPSPHLGVAYDLTGKGTTVIRSGISVAYAYQDGTGWFTTPYAGTMPTAAQLFSPNGSYITGPGTITTFTTTSTPVTANSVISGNFLPWSEATPIWTASSFLEQCGNGLAPVNPVAGAPTVNPPQCAMAEVYPSWKLPYLTTWNLSVEHAFTSNLTFQAAYVGTHGTDLDQTGDINQPTAGSTGTSAEEQRRPYYSEFPWFGKATFHLNGGKSNYDGLQLTLNERMSHGLSFLVSYTQSHSLSTNGTISNLGNQAAQYGNAASTAATDFREQFNLTITYALPGRKSPLQLLEGWSLSSEFEVLGNPGLTLTDSVYDTSGTGTGLDFWDLYGNKNDFSKILGGASSVPCYAVTGTKGLASSGVCNLVGSVGAMPASCMAGAMAAAPSPAGVTGNTTGMLALQNIGCYVAGPNQESAITPPAQGTWGTMQPGEIRNGGSGGFKNWDLALHKDWRIKERYVVQFRAEGFNVLNRTDYGVPLTNLGQAASMGLSSHTPDVTNGNPVFGSGGPREVQLQLHLTF